MLLPRCGGILLHPTALPGPHGIGCAGAAARGFIDFLAASGQRLWQMLPLGPTGAGDSPYSALSAFAGSPLLIDLEELVARGELEAGDLSGAPPAGTSVDFATVRRFKKRCLDRAAANFAARGDRERHAAFAAFCTAQSHWLDDYALFVALRRHHRGASWQQWPEPLRRRDPVALARWRERLGQEVEGARYRQFCFDSQWQALKDYAGARGISLFGDLPIFVALDSADTWSRQELFRLDPQGRPTAVAGVPPDYFSATGQLWGNPIYAWEAHRANGFAWWRRRLSHELGRADLVRIDHFRGLEACWAVPAGAATAIAGAWEKSPGEELCRALREECGGTLPVIAEDLGVITPEVDALRRAFALPGMKILHFAFDSGPGNPYLPHNHERNCVVYTGTHDNATTRGWWKALDAAGRRRVADYLGSVEPPMPEALVRLAMASIADLCVIPCQDLLGLDDRARFNRPGEADGNWGWRLTEGQLDGGVAAALRRLTESCGR